LAALIMLDFVDSPLDFTAQSHAINPPPPHWKSPASLMQTCVWLRVAVATNYSGGKSRSYDFVTRVTIFCIDSGQNYIEP